MNFDLDGPGTGLIERFAAGKAVVDAVAVGFKKVFVGQSNALTAVRLDGEDAGSDEVVTGELEQSRITDTGDNPVVKTTGF